MLFDSFRYFIRERHTIYLKRKAGEQAPWTKDDMLREYKFTNIYRELDRTTIWCKENVRDKFDDPYILAMAITAFRFFNRISTGEAMFKTGAWDVYIKNLNTISLRSWILHERPNGPYTTGAYIIKTVNGMNKLDGALWAIKEAKPMVDTLLREKPTTLAHAQQIIRTAPYLGSFMAAQLVADMKYTKLLDKATDWHTWAASGPGSKRGLNILWGMEPEKPWNEKEWLHYLQSTREEIIPMFEELGWEIPHAQDVQNMLCEFSKYQRGYSRNKFVPSK